MGAFITLENFEFAETEIPSSMPFGGDQSLSVHKLIGGFKVVDAMGYFPGDLTWSGVFLGGNAVLRANYLKGLAEAGKPVTLKWGEFSYLVVVRQFQPTYLRSVEVSYTITCEAVADGSALQQEVTLESTDFAVASDNSTAQALGAQINDSALTSALSTLDSAIKSVSTFASATTSTINSVLQPIAAVQARVKTLITATENTIASVTTFGGILPNNPVSISVARLADQTNAVLQQGNLLQLNSILGRMSKNVSGSTAGSGVVTVSNTNLFSVAGQAYGDPSAWTGIAKANGLTDPFVPGIATLNIPSVADKADGVLSS